MEFLTLMPLFRTASLIVSIRGFTERFFIDTTCDLGIYMLDTNKSNLNYKCQAQNV